MSIEQISDRMIIDTIDTEAPSILCWTDQQRAAWYREMDRDAQDDPDARYLYNVSQNERTL